MKEFGLIIKLLVVVALVIAFGDYLPVPVQQGLLALSYLVKDILTFFIPFIVFIYIASCLMAFQRSAPVLVGVLLAMILVVNYAFIFMGYSIGSIFMPDMSNVNAAGASIDQQGLVPLFDIQLPQLISTDMALILGTLAGLVGTFWGNRKLKEAADVLKGKVQWALSHLFIPILPIYVMGFLVKVQYDDSLSEMFANYAPIMLMIVGAQFIAMLTTYAVAGNANPQRVFNYIKTAFSSGLVGFSTISSAATMPVTLQAAEKNTKNPKLAQLVIPATANINLIADSVTVPILVAAVYAVNGMPPMGIEAFVVFSLFYLIAKFGVAGVPGGGIIVVAPILEAQFGFSSQMTGLIITLYILLDPFITAFNVMSNGGFAILVNRICGKMKAFQEEAPVAVEAVS